MSIPFSRPLTALLALTCQSAAIGADRVPQYPTKPIRLILPFAPGGGADLTGRLVAPGLTERLGQPHISAGRMRALAITSAERSKAKPEWPTVAESGLPDYQTGLWFGFMAPAATPNPIIRRLHKELVSILTQPELVNNIRSQGGDVVAGTPEAFARTLRDDIARYEKIIRAAGIVQQ